MSSDLCLEPVRWILKSMQAAKAVHGTAAVGLLHTHQRRIWFWAVPQDPRRLQASLLDWSTLFLQHRCPGGRALAHPPGLTLGLGPPGPLGWPWEAAGEEMRDSMNCEVLKRGCCPWDLRGDETSLYCTHLLIMDVFFLQKVCPWLDVPLMSYFSFL